MRVFDGTQSVSTDAPPRPSQSTTVTSAPSCAATSAASYPPGPPPMITIRVTYSIVPHASRCFRPGARSPCIRAASVTREAYVYLPYPRPHVALRRVRRQSRPAAHDAPRPPLAASCDRVAARLAADVRGRAHGLGGRPGHDRGGAPLAGLRRALRHRAHGRGVD